MLSCAVSGRRWSGWTRHWRRWREGKRRCACGWGKCWRCRVGARASRSASRRWLRMHWSVAIGASAGQRPRAAWLGGWRSCPSCVEPWRAARSPGAWASCWRAWPNLKTRRTGSNPPPAGPCGRCEGSSARRCVMRAKRASGSMQHSGRRRRAQTTLAASSTQRSGRRQRRRAQTTLGAATTKATTTSMNAMTATSRRCAPSAAPLRRKTPGCLRRR
jgi:hypothetical protein